MSVLHQFAFTQLSAIVADEVPSTDVVYSLPVVTFTHEMLNLGYELAQDAYIYLTVLGDSAGAKCEELLAIAKKAVGAHRALRAFYPNFPEQVIQAEEGELFFNAIIHYWSRGAWKPEYLERKRELFTEKNPKTKLKLISLAQLKEHFFQALQAKSVLGTAYYDFIEAGLQKSWFEEFTGEIVFKEILCRVAVHRLNDDKSIKGLVKSSTDVLRVMVALSDHKTGLDKTRGLRFKSLKRKIRRKIVEALDDVITIADVKPYRRLWIQAFHCLHIGEYKGVSSEIASRLRNEKSIPTEETLINEAIKSGDTVFATNHLLKTPPILLRHIDKLLRDSTEEEAKYILSEFAAVAGKINTKLLLQLLSHFKGRAHYEIEKRVVFTKGVAGHALLAPPLKHLSHSRTVAMRSIIEKSLTNQFKERGKFKGKKVFIDPCLKKILPPSQLGSVQPGKKTLYRGSQISFAATPEDKAKNTIRLFVHWIGFDIDLSVLFVTQSLDRIDTVSYQRLKNGFCFHSGDIVVAPPPKGASEFIDIDISAAIKEGYRYACMDLRVYNGPEFSQHDECFAGFMFRDSAHSGEIFEPASVINKFDLVSEETTSIPCAFDMLERKIIWMDIPSKHISNAPNSLNSNIASSVKILKAYLDMAGTKVSMYELMQLHADAVEAELTDARENADCIVGFGEGDVDVQNVADILTNWI